MFKRRQPLSVKLERSHHRRKPGLNWPFKDEQMVKVKLFEPLQRIRLMKEYVFVFLNVKIMIPLKCLILLNIF